MPHTLRPYKVEVRTNIHLRPDLTRHFATFRQANIHKQRLRANGLPAEITMPPRHVPMTEGNTHLRIAA